MPVVTSNTFGVTVAGYLVESAPAQLDNLQVFYPRPDIETNTWARHRKNYPGIPYRVGVTPCYGRPPYYFELITAPSGMTVGNFLVDDGSGTGRLVDDGDYGVVEWTNPTTGTHDITVRVYDQTDGNFVDISWQLVVGTSGFIFVDPVSGNDSTGDGTIGNPFQTNTGWHSYGGDPYVVDNQYAGYHVIYRAGTHTLQPVNDPGVDSYYWQLDESDVPLVHYGYYGENVTLDFSNVVCQFNGGRGTGTDSQDAYFGHMTIANNYQKNSPRFFEMLQTDAGTPENYDGTGDHQRMTWHDITWGSFTANGYNLNNNSGYIWAEQAATGGGTGKVRHYIVLNHCDSDGFDLTGNTGGEVNCNMLYLGSARYATWWQGTVTNYKASSSRGTLVAKAGGCRFFTFNLDASSSTNTNSLQFATRNTDSDTAYGYRDDWGWNEFAYCKGQRIHIGNSAHSATWPNTDVAGTNEGPDRITRCTFVADAGDTALAIGNVVDWPNEIRGAIFVSDQSPFYSGFAPDESGYNDYTLATNPTDSNMNLTPGNSALRGEYGAEIFLNIGGS